MKEKLPFIVLVLGVAVLAVSCIRFESSSTAGINDLTSLAGLAYGTIMVLGAHQVDQWLNHK